MFETPEVAPSGLKPVCPKCQGTGKISDKMCPACRGTGLKPPATSTYRDDEGDLYYRSTDPFVDGQRVGQIVPSFQQETGVKDAGQ